MDPPHLYKKIYENFIFTVTATEKQENTAAETETPDSSPTLAQPLHLLKRKYMTIGKMHAQKQVTLT